jgi:hypothetical protein
LFTICPPSGLILKTRYAQWAKRSCFFQLRKNFEQSLLAGVQGSYFDGAVKWFVIKSIIPQANGFQFRQ